MNPAVTSSTVSNGAGLGNGAGLSNGAGAADSTPLVIHHFFEYSLLGMLGVGFAAVLAAGFADVPFILATVLALLGRLLLVTGVIRFTIPPRWITAVAIAYLGFFPVDVYYLSGSFLSGTIHMVFFLAVLKLLTARTPRDYSYLKVIAVLELIAAALLSASLNFLFFLALFVFLAVATFASGEVRRSTPGERTVISRPVVQTFSRRMNTLVVCLLAGILFLAAGLFLVLPRTARAALERLIPQRYHMAGFSNSVRLGEIGELQQSNTAVLHVRSFQDGRLPAVKWRGSALTDFDGFVWSNPHADERQIRVEGGGVALRTAVLGRRQGLNLLYRVRAEPMASDTLFFAGQPETINIEVPFLMVGRNGAIHVPQRYTNGRALDYSVRGFLPDEWAEVRFTSSPLAGSAREELLALPKLDPRIPELARQMTYGAANDIQQARAIESHLRRDFGYTLQLLDKPVDDPLAHFLFVRKKGHCEYFASSMAVMLRTMGIPSRVVTGFQSGVYNPMTGWQVIRAADAHSWVEAWLDGRGWTTFDPTPFATGSTEPSLMARLALLQDAAAQYWQDWVVGYDLSQQVALASRIQANSRRMHLPDLSEWIRNAKAGAEKVAALIPWFAGIALLAAAGWLGGPRILRWWRMRARALRVQQGRVDKSDATILYEEMLALLKARGLQKPAWLTPQEFVGVLPASETSRLVNDATRAYNELRFGGRAGAAARFVNALEQIRKSPA